MRASSLRRSTRLTASAISRAVGGRLRSSSVKIARICDTVTAGVFPPIRPRSRMRNHNARQRQRDVVMPAHPTANLVVAQPHLTLALLQHLLDLVSARPRPHHLGQRLVRRRIAQANTSSPAAGRGCASPAAAPPGRSAASAWRTPGPTPPRPPGGPCRPRGSSGGSSGRPAACWPRCPPARTGPHACGPCAPSSVAADGRRGRGRWCCTARRARTTGGRSRSAARNSEARPNSSSPTTHLWGTSGALRRSRSRAISQVLR